MLEPQHTRANPWTERTARHGRLGLWRIAVTSAAPSRLAHLPEALGRGHGPAVPGPALREAVCPDLLGLLAELVPRGEVFRGVVGEGTHDIGDVADARVRLVEVLRVLLALATRDRRRVLRDAEAFRLPSHSARRDQEGEEHGALHGGLGWGLLFTVLVGSDSREAMVFFANVGLMRRETPLLVGGGLITDICGTACALYRRSTAYVRLPTTLIGMIDAAIAIKVGGNLAEKHKNRIGAFHPHSGVIIDFSLPATLSEAHVRNGVAELIKISP